MWLWDAAAASGKWGSGRVLLGVGGFWGGNGRGGGGLVVRAKKVSQSVGVNYCRVGESKDVQCCCRWLTAAHAATAQSWVDPTAAEIRVEVGSHPIGSWLHRRWDHSDPCDHFSFYWNSLTFFLFHFWPPFVQYNNKNNIIITTATIIKIFLFFWHDIKFSSFLSSFFLSFFFKMCVSF